MEKFKKSIKIFNYSKKEKISFFDGKMINLVKSHYNLCKPYKNMLKLFNYNLDNKNIKKIPPLPVSLFKNIDLLSVKKNKIIKTLLSSGTSGIVPSKIYLDGENSKNLTWVLTKIVESILGKKRIPMLIVDQNPRHSNRYNFNARIAAINGFSIFGKNITYLIDNNNKFKINELNKFLSIYGNDNFLIFGFTSIVYQHLLKNDISRKLKYNLKKGILIHGGGWKKLTDISITNKMFKDSFRKKYSLNKIHNYYGLVEQTGSIFIECEKCSLFKCSIYSDIFIRDKHLNIIEEKGKKGFLQVMSLIPSSYPGNNLLTEDIAEIVDSKKCKSCTHNYYGKLFKVYGRANNSEIRGCSNI
jgi:phenylacetate-coenzyme A ligase PaaK-like adenylate-forming protein